MDTSSFLNEVESYLGTPFPSLAERCTGGVLKTLHRRIATEQARHIEAHLPQDLKDIWDEGFGFQRMDKHEFLEAVRQECGFRNTDEAYYATRAVFAALKLAIPPKDVRDTAAVLPEDLREIWLAVE
jgi:uncharacterized protein (DUF2267 family)